MYELHYDRKSMGATVGQHKVVIQTGGGDVEGDYGAVAREKIPAKYNVDTELVANVQGGTNTIDFPLESGGEIIQPPGVNE